MVYYFTRIVPEYRTGALDALNKRLGGRLVVCSGDPPQGSSLGSLGSLNASSVANVRLRNLWISGERSHFQNFLPAFSRYGRPSAILAEESPRSVSLPMLMYWAARHNVPLGLWGHFSSNRRGDSGRSWQDRYRRALARRADACVCYTDAIARRLDGVPPERIFVARNTLDTPTLFALHDRLAAEGKTAVRQRLGLNEHVDFLSFSGRLTEAKGATVLIDLVEHLQREREIGLIVIGDGPLRGEMERQSERRRLRDIHFLGPLTSYDDSAPYLFASDLLVLPGVAGLAINHAFALGLPVVTRAAPDESRYHGPEIDYIVNGSNGLIMPTGAVEDLAQGVTRILDRRQAFSEAARAYARRHLRLEGMVDGLEAAIRHLEGRGAGE